MALSRGNEQVIKAVRQLASALVHQIQLGFNQSGRDMDQGGFVNFAEGGRKELEADLIRRIL